MSEYKTRVLLVEDEELARKTLSFYLNTIFDDVVIACDGDEGSKIYEENASKGFDLVLTDIRMPNKDGMEMIEDILKINSTQRFIIVSAYKNEEDLLKLINLRVLGYFVKPLNVDDMMEMLQKAKDEVLADNKVIAPVQNSEIIKLNKNYSYKKGRNALYRNGESVKLSNKESQILNVLIDNLGEVVSVDSFKVAVWDDITTSDSAFRTVMKRLKDKVKDHDFIISHKGYGYIIDLPL